MVSPSGGYLLLQGGILRTMIIKLVFVAIALIGLLAYLLKLRKQKSANPTQKIPKCHVPVEKTFGEQTVKCPHGCQNAGTKDCPFEAEK